MHNNVYYFIFLQLEDKLGRVFLLSRWPAARRLNVSGLFLASG